MLNEVVWVVILIIIFVIVFIAIYALFTTSMHVFAGGSHSANLVNWSDIEILQELGSGAFGDVFVAKYNGEIFALKREKVLPKQVIQSGNKVSLKPSHELKFYKFIESLPREERKYFIRLHAHRVIRCMHKHKLPEHLQNMIAGEPARRKRHDALTKSPYCAEYLIEFGGNSLKSLIDDIMAKGMIVKDADMIQMRKITKQILEIIRILRRYGYIIGDLHSGNITLIKSDVKLIDYGEVRKATSNKYTKNAFGLNSDLLSLIMLLLNNGYFFINYLSKLETFPPYAEYIKFIRTIPGAWERVVGSILQINDDKKITDIVDKINKGIIETEQNDKKVAQVLGPYVYLVFATFYPDEELNYWRKVSGLDIPDIPFLIPQKDLIYILENYHNIDALINYFAT